MKTITRKTKFSCHTGDATTVFVAGTFNEWNPESIPLKKGKTGNWNTTVALAPGRYEFKFIVDGQWCCEPGCEGEHRGCPKCVPNECGSMNRVLEVKK